MPKRYSYSTLPKYPRRRVEQRIKIPQPIKRPMRFQARSLIRYELLQRDPYYYVLHRRGPDRTKVGEDPLEARAVPASLIRGTLPERIVWRFLVEYMRFVPDVDFDFQSSLQGGRIDTGGIVADFKFTYIMIVIQVQGPTHEEYLRIQKDDEQTMALKEMGYDVFPIEDTTIYNELELEDWMRRTFNLYHGGSQDTANVFTDYDEFSLIRAREIINEIGDLQNVL